MTKPKNQTYTENRDHCCWIIGYNACKARTLRRLNQFKRGTEAYAQWCYGWDAAYKERNLTDRRRDPLPRDYANERLRSYLNKAKLPK